MGNEINMLAKLRHLNIILMIGIFSLPPNLCIAMEYRPNGSFHDLLYKQKVDLKYSERAYIVRQIVSTIYHLHSHSIVHRDIKSHNFLVRYKLLIKLCNCGLAKHSVNGC
jgi:serine/threonine protein kinase